MTELMIKELSKSDPVPYKLLLLADPNKELVDKYLKNGKCFVAKNESGRIIGEYVLINKSKKVIEIINIAVDPKSQGQGIGKKLILDAIERVRSYRVNELEIGTGNSSLSQLGLYQKCGFRIVGIEKDFFVKNYTEPIFENGILCVDMIRLAITL